MLTLAFEARELPDQDLLERGDLRPVARWRLARRARLEWVRFWFPLRVPPEAGWQLVGEPMHSQSTPGLSSPDAVVVGEGKQRWTGWPVPCRRADRLEQRLPFVPTSRIDLSFASSTPLTRILHRRRTRRAHGHPHLGRESAQPDRRGQVRWVSATAHWCFGSALQADGFVWLLPVGESQSMRECGNSSSWRYRSQRGQDGADQGQVFSSSRYVQQIGVQKPLNPSSSASNMT